MTEYTYEERLDPTGILLTPSYHGEECLGNGEHPDYECCCDECPFYLACFPNWRDFDEHPPRIKSPLRVQRTFLMTS